jgi:aminoglycoside phosphotransferase family enzyme/predicted kinase
MLGETKELPGIKIKYPASIDFAEMMGQLAQPGAFPFALTDSESIPVLQMHASAVMLTPSRVYKVKKPKNFGFLNFSTPLLRHHFCEQEVRLNAPRAPHIYLGVAPVLLFSDGRFRFGPTCPPGQVPLPGTPLAGGLVVDYAVVMVRLPEKATLEARVRAGTADALLLAEIAQYVAASHLKASTSEDIASFGSLEVIRGNWEENFEQMKPCIGRTLGDATYGSIVEFVHHFLEERTALFAHRVSGNRIRDCHGDLRLQHVYVLGEQENPVYQLPRLAILDCIEFNERFRYSDVASEVAFLTMELDALGRPDLAVAFVDEYVAATNDDELPELLPFYTCYRACVRGKVLSFQLDEPEVPATQRQAACQEAKSLFTLAAHYAGSPVRPTLVMIGGLMGTGKSTVALALHHELGWKLCSSDMTRKQLAHIDPTQPRGDAFGQGLYTAEWTARTYDALCREAGETLSDGRSVLLDASFLHRVDRQALAREAATRGAAAVFIECICPRDIALQRLAERWKKRVEREFFSLEAASSASDGRPDLYDAQCGHWDAFIANEELHIKHIVVTTTQPLAVNVEQVLETLGIARLACQLVSE